VGEQRHPARAEARRNEARALDPDVPAGGEARVDDHAGSAAGIDRHDSSADLVRRDQLARIATEGAGGDGHPALYPGRPLRDRAQATPAVDRVEVRGAFDPRGDQQSMAEAANIIERDPIGKRLRGKRDEWPRLAARVDHHHAGWSHFERVDVVAAKGTVRAGHSLPSPYHGEISLRAGARGISAGPSCESAKPARRIEEE